MNQIKKKINRWPIWKECLPKKKYEAQFQTNSFILNNKIKNPKKKTRSQLEIACQTCDSSRDDGITPLKVNKK
jgi:hypothetical protein